MERTRTDTTTTLRRVLPRVRRSATVLSVVLAIAAPATAQQLVRGDDLDVRGGVLRLGPDDACCPAGACSGTLRLDNRDAYDGTLEAIEISASSLSGPGAEIAAARVFIDPRLVDTLGPGQSRTVTVTVAVPESTVGGSYRGGILIRAMGGAFLATLPYEVTICASHRPSLTIVPNVGDFDGETLRLVSDDGCRGDDLAARFMVANDGAMVLGSIVAQLERLTELAPAFAPETTSLAPGQRAELRLNAHAPAALADGLHRGVLRVRDVSTGAEGAVKVVYERCARRGGPDDRPPNNGPIALTLTHRSSKSALRPGEVTTLTVTVRNDGATRVHGLTISEALPRGFVYAKGRSAVDGNAAAEPRGRGQLRWQLGELLPGAETTLAFQITVTSAARRGVNSVRASARAGVTDVGPVDATIEVVHGSQWFGGVIEGVVHDTHGQPIVGAPLLLDYDRETTTDEAGRFEFEQVRPGEHVVALDRPALAESLLPTSPDRVIVNLFTGASADTEFIVGRRPRLSLILTPHASP